MDWSGSESGSGIGSGVEGSGWGVEVTLSGVEMVLEGSRKSSRKGVEAQEDVEAEDECCGADASEVESRQVERS